MNKHALPEIDPRIFRHVMGRFASGVTVITADDGDAVRGMTASAFMSGSLEPPLCVVSVAKRAHMHALLIDAAHFGVSILGEDQQAYSGHFAGRPAPDLPVVFDRIGPVALLSGACARIAARVHARHECGDHTLFVGHIFHLDADDRPALVYHAGRYARLAYRRAGREDSAPEFW